jgi:hypothetical protein
MCLCDEVAIKSKWIRYTIVALVLTVGFAAIPMILVLALPIMCTAGATGCGGFPCCNNNECCGAICLLPAMLCGFNCGLMWSPLAIVGALCVGPFVLCFGGYEVWDEYISNVEAAKRTAKQKIDAYNQKMLLEV